ncbi:hypothetical protein SAMN04487969_11343 [Paenibacillus algorifonticola]|uniref:MmyB-like transcription regulator ligand binding domain-containing protein n=1 Tax=Paenibacillus algorifonticola TaxID=684063 RepID=A0A1I2FQB0_9BACL|nr:hypothetical protein [Paenibacillus algorifonticola]SFF07654.1 hypothetical protein SAMN04487969_11343 [Paenibacillus algorifonticola]
MELWNPHVPDAVSSLHTTLNPQWQDIIGQLSYPSFISNEKTQVLAWNEAASEIIADFASWPASERIMLRLMFTDESLRRPWPIGRSSHATPWRCFEPIMTSIRATRGLSS